MSQRTNKVASLVQQIAAMSLRDHLAEPKITVTSVDVSPDLRHATVWVGIIHRDEAELESLLAAATRQQGAVQRAVAAGLTTKFVPRIAIKHDTGADHAERINKLIYDSRQ